MKVLVACEESQRVCTEFRKLGHEAYSCDIEPCSGGHPEWHIQNDVLPKEKRQSTKIAGNWFNKGGKERQKNRAKTFPGIAKAMAEQWGGE